MIKRKRSKNLIIKEQKNNDDDLIFNMKKEIKNTEQKVESINKFILSVMTGGESNDWILSR